MVDERAALSLPGPPAATKGAAGVTSMAPPPSPSPQQSRPPPISIQPASNGDIANGNGSGHGGGTHARTPDENAPQPSPRTKRFTPVRALHVGTGGSTVASPPAVPEGEALGTETRPSQAASTPFPTSPKLGVGASSSAAQAAGMASQPTPVAGPSSNSLAPPSPTPPSHQFTRRLSNIDRRVRSEALPAQKRHMSFASSRRPSILTGGYESSTDEETKGHKSPGNHQIHRPSLLNPSAHAASHAHAHLAGGGSGAAGRRRAQSLLVTPHEAWPHGGASATTPPGTSRRPSRLGRPAATGSPLRIPTGGSAGGSGTPTGSLSRAASDAPSRAGRSGSTSGRPREASGVSGDKSERDDREHQRSMEQRRNNPLAASLGLGTARPAILSPDQIEHLLADADVNSAMARMAKPMRRQSSVISNNDHPPNQQPPSSAPSNTTSFTTSPSAAAPHTTTFAVTPPPLARPYLVTAPPALTADDDWEGRNRATSVSSSIATTTTTAGTPLRNVTPYNRRRALSTATTESDGGHVPYTHYGPAVIPGDSDIDEEPVLGDKDDLVDEPPPVVDEEKGKDKDRTATATPVNGGDKTPIPGYDVKDDAKTKEDARIKEDKARRRISGMFSLRKKRDPSPPPVAIAHAHAHAQAQAAKRRAVDPAPERQRDRDAEMRRAEQERREEEAAQELRYRSMMQISAHPASQRRALRAATHIDAYYSLLYEALENPPKLNPLAILRWVRRTEEQKEARAKWMREHAEQADHARLTSPLPWQGMLSRVSSPASDRLRPLASSRPPGGGAALPPRSVASAASKEVVIAPGWHYTLDDIQGYNASGGRIDFFIPPVLDVEPEVAEPSDPAERPLSAAISERSDANMSQPSVVSGTARDKEMAVAVPRIASPSTPSLGQSGENGEDGSLSAGGISRTTSIDNGQRPIRQQRLPRHRSHQSTSGIPQPKPLHTLRALGTGVRRNLAAAVHTPGTDYDEEHRGGSSALPWSTVPSVTDSPHGQPNSRSALPWNPLAANDSANAHNHVSTLSLRDRGLLGLRSRGDGAATSDEDHPHHLRRFLVRRRPVAAFERLSRRATAGDHHDARGHTVSRSAELRNLEQALARERTLREAQAKKVKSRSEQRTELELQAEERLREVEDEVYAERENRLHDAQQRLERAETESEQMDAAISHFLIQLDQVRSVFRTAADVDIKFENLDALGRPERRDTDDEEADHLGPLRDGAEYSDRSKWLAPRGKARRQTTLSSSPTLPSFAHGLSAWPKRSTLDPTLGVALDPFRRVELSCEKARATVRAMDDKRAAATRQMQDMVGGVNALIAQKDAVRAWAKAANERIVALKATKANKAGKVHGGLFATLWQGPGIDMATDMFVRACLAVFSYGIRVGRVISWVRGRGWLAWAMLGGVLSMLVVFYLFGAEGAGEGVGGSMERGAEAAAA